MTCRKPYRLIYSKSMHSFRHAAPLVIRYKILRKICNMLLRIDATAWQNIYRILLYYTSLSHSVAKHL